MKSQQKKKINKTTRFVLKKKMNKKTTKAQSISIIETQTEAISGTEKQSS